MKEMGRFVPRHCCTRHVDKKWNASTLCCRYHDPGAINIMQNYLREHQLPPGTNLLRHHFGLMGLQDWIPNDLEVVRPLPFHR